MSRSLPAIGWMVTFAFCNGILSGQTPEATPQQASKVAKEHAEKQFRDVIEPVLKRDCFACHSEKKATAGLDLQSLKPDFASDTSGEMWQRVFERVRDREMPPRKPGELEPPLTEAAAAERRKFVEALSDALRLRSRGSWGEIKPVAISGDDDPVLRLRKQIRNNAAQQVDISRNQYIAGRVTLGMVLESEQNLGQAELALATTPDERIATLKQLVESARVTEDVVWTQFEAQVVDQGHLMRAKHIRLEAQLRLRQELDKK